MTYRLRKLTLGDEEKFLAYHHHWKEESMVPHALSLEDRTFQAHLSMLSLREQGLYKPDMYVPDKLYVMVDEQDTFLGMLNLRLSLNEHLLDYGGHIGYGIHPCHRNKGLGKMILKLGLEKAKRHGIFHVLVTCNEENIASRKVIEGCGGQYENKLYKTDGYILRYWIHLNP